MEQNGNNMKQLWKNGNNYEKMETTMEKKMDTL